jgi:hypothetical protein
VTAWGPTVSAPVVHVALPLLSSVWVPPVQVIGLSLSEKTTVPVGVPDVVALTAAVKVTFWPNTEELAGEAVTAVVVGAWLTVWT